MPVSTECAQCGKPLLRKPCDVATHKHLFCNRKCGGAWNSLNSRGAQSPLYMGGKVLVSCDHCGKPIELSRHKAERSRRHFCTNNGRRCQSEWAREQVGEKAGAWGGGNVTVACAECGKELERYPYKLSRSKRFFCTLRCRSIWDGKNNAGASADYNGDKVKLECAQCGGTVERYPSGVRNRQRVFCTRRCRGDWLSVNVRGENSPRWRGGSTEARNEWKRNGGWQWLRLCRKRDDNTCQRCGEHFKGRSSTLHVHHKASFTDYNEWRSVLENGMCLCEQCHRWIHSNDGELVRYRWEQDAIATLTQNVA